MPVVAEFLEQRRFVAHLNVDGIDEVEISVFLARVVTALEHVEIDQFGIGDLQSLHDGRSTGLFGMVDGELEFGEAQHGGSSNFMAGGNPAVL